MLDAMVKIWCDWIDRTDCDGFRVDTFKHVPPWVAKESRQPGGAHAAARGKSDSWSWARWAAARERQADYLVAIPEVRSSSSTNGAERCAGSRTATRTRWPPC